MHTLKRLIIYSALAGIVLTGCKRTEPPASDAGTAPPPIDKLAIPVCLNDHCGVVDQDGKALIPFENAYGNIVSSTFGDTVLVAENGLWSLLSANGTPIKPALAGQIRLLMPGYYGFQSKGKYGVIDAHGNEVQPARFDALYSSYDNAFAIYEIGGKSGILGEKAELVTEAVYDDIDVSSNARERGMLVTAARGGQNWVIDIRGRTQTQVGYGKLDKINDGHLVASTQDGARRGLADARGKLVIDAHYSALGTPESGLVSFTEKPGGPCGYLDYAGKTVIPARFADCLPFGKQSAMAQAREADGSPGKYGAIDRQGTWVVQPSYDYAMSAGLTMFGSDRHVSGLATIGIKDGLLSVKYGLFDTDHGKELFKPLYATIGGLDTDLFVFTDEHSPQVKVELMGDTNPLPAVGVMDRDGKTVLKASAAIRAELVESGRYLSTLNGMNKSAKTGIYDRRGQAVVPPDWQKVVLYPERGFALAYEVADDDQETLAALYDLKGRPRFTLRHLACGADQLVDGAGKPIWPLDAQKFCK